MSTERPAQTTSPTGSGVGRRTLETMPERVLRLLRSIAGEPAIRGPLAEHGWSEADHHDGWRLLHAAAGYRAPDGDADRSDDDVRASIAELGAIDEKIFRIANATLSRRFPDQAGFLLGGIGPGRGAAAVLALDILLHRVDELAARATVAGLASDDHRALALLERRILPPSERDRLRALLAIAKRSSPVADDGDRREQRTREHLEALARLRDWYDEWAEIAHAAIKRRDLLIRMGLAEQRKRGPAANGSRANG